MRSALFLTAVLAATACKNKGEDEEEVAAENQPPVADAGAAVDQSADTAVTLDGGASLDPDGDVISFHWSFDTVPQDSALAEQEDPFPGNDTTASTTKFWADAPGTYVVKLVVTDEHGLDSSPDYVIITITEGDAPVADAGPDHEGTEGETFTLDGSGSYDPLARAITYSWTFASLPEGSALSGLTNSDSVSPSFVADRGGVYIASLVVDNGISSSDPDTATIYVSSADPQPPVALANDDMTGEDCTEITLDGSSSYDPNGDALTYQWALQSAPEDSSASNDSFGDRTAAETSFMGDAAGTYVVSLSVSDGTEWSSPDLVTIELEERSYNTAPVVDAGTSKAIDAGEATCEEDGYTYDCESCASQIADLGDDATITDPDGDAMTIEWTVVSGEATIDDASAESTTVTLQESTPTEPGECEDTEYEFQVSATDCTGETTTDTVIFTVTCCGVMDTGTATTK